MAKRIAIANHKGGVGKSTTTMILAEGLALAGYRILVVDMDPQATSSRMLLGASGLDEAVKQKRTLAKLLEQLSEGEVPQITRFRVKSSDLAELREAPEKGAVDIIPSDPTLLANLGPLEDSIRRAFPLTRIDVTLSAMLGSAIAAIEKNYDVIIIDCPAGSNALSHTAARLSTDIIAPTSLEENSYVALKDFLKIILERDLGIERLRAVHVLLTMYMATNPVQQQMLDQIRSGALGKLNAFQRPVPHSTAFQRAALHSGTGNYRRAREKYGSALADVVAVAKSVEDRIIKRD